MASLNILMSLSYEFGRSGPKENLKKCLRWESFPKRCISQSVPFNIAAPYLNSLSFCVLIKFKDELNTPEKYRNAKLK